MSVVDVWAQFECTITYSVLHLAITLKGRSIHPSVDGSGWGNRSLPIEQLNHLDKWREKAEERIVQTDFTAWLAHAYPAFSSHRNRIGGWSVIFVSIVSDGVSYKNSRQCVLWSGVQPMWVKWALCLQNVLLPWFPLTSQFWPPVPCPFSLLLLCCVIGCHLANASAGLGKDQVVSGVSLLALDSAVAFYFYPVTFKNENIYLILIQTEPEMNNWGHPHLCFLLIMHSLCRRSDGGGSKLWVPWKHTSINSVKLTE